MIYNHQFGFKNNHSTYNALIDITKKIRSALDKGIFACGIYIDLQKAFDMVNHSILVDKLEYYVIRGVPKMWLESFLIGRHQFTHIKDRSSSKLPITHGVPQGSVLGPLLFLLYINDLHKAIQHSSVHHFADDTNLLYTNNSLKKINKHINHDIKHLCQWLRSNKISLNASKTEIIIFKTKLKTITKHLNFRVSGQKINPTTSVKYLGVHLSDSLTWEIHFKNLQTKLNRAIGLLSKIRHYTPKSLLKTIYFSLFNSHLIYACQIWGQSKTKLFQEIEKLQDKAIRIISFLPKGASVKEAYSTLKILKIRDFISLQNALLVKDVFEEKIPSPFMTYFKKLNTQHLHATRSAMNQSAFVPIVNTEIHGINSIKYRSVEIWNKLQKALPDDLLNLTRTKAKEQITTTLLKSYLSP